MPVLGYACTQKKGGFKSQSCEKCFLPFWLQQYRVEMQLAVSAQFVKLSSSILCLSYTMFT